MPALTAGYSGFVNGDTASRLTTLPTLTTTATAGSPVGRSDHRQRRGEPELHHQLCQRHADRDKNGQKLINDTTLSGILAITNLGDGSVAIGGEGIPGFTYLVQYTASPLSTTDWLTLGTVTADSLGAFSLMDSAGSARKVLSRFRPREQ